MQHFNWLMDFCLLSASCAHAHRGLEAIVDPPLEASKGTNHNHTRAETSCSESTEADLVDNRAEALAFILGLTKLGDERVCRVRDYGTDNTREVAGGESNTELCRLAVGILWLSEDVGIEELDNLFKEEELGHGVRDLTGPQRDERAEGEAGVDFGATHFFPGGPKGNGEGTGRTCLDLDLGHLQRAECNIREKLGACGTSEPNGALVILRRFLTSEIHIRILEDLIEAILEHALEGISDESGADAFPDALCGLLRDYGLQGTEGTNIFGRVYLHVTFSNIKWGDAGVGETTRKDTAKHALGIVGRVMGNRAKIPGIPLSGRGEVRHRGVN